MGIPPSIRLLAAAALGVAAVALPAAAASEGTPTIETEDPVHHWKPPTATIEAGGAVTFKNASATVPHGVHWISGPGTPICDPSVPVGTNFETGTPNWSGNCRFAAAGTYVFWCTVHGESMKGSITVTPGAGKEPPGEPPPPGMPTSTTPGTPPPPGGTQGQGGSPSPGSAGGTAAAASTAALSALRLAVPRHGGVLHVSLVVPSADAGGRLEADLLAPGRVRVGRLVKSGLHAGHLGFALAPSPHGLRTLRRHGSLKLTMTVRLQAPGGAGGAVSRRLTLHR